MTALSESLTNLLELIKTIKTNSDAAFKSADAAINRVNEQLRSAQKNNDSQGAEKYNNELRSSLITAEGLYHLSDVLNNISSKISGDIDKIKNIDYGKIEEKLDKIIVAVNRNKTDLSFDLERI